MFQSTEFRSIYRNTLMAFSTVSFITLFIRIALSLPAMRSVGTNSRFDISFNNSLIPFNKSRSVFINSSTDAWLTAAQRLLLKIDSRWQKQSNGYFFQLLPIVHSSPSKHVQKHLSLFQDIRPALHRLKHNVPKPFSHGDEILG